MTSDTEATGHYSLWSGEDFLDHAGAARLAGEIRSYWGERGYTVSTRVTMAPHGTRPVVCLRSDLVNGLPQDFAKYDHLKILADLRERWPKPKPVPKQRTTS